MDSAENREEISPGGLPLVEGLKGERLIRAIFATILGFLFSRLHVVFSAKPMAIALVAFLPSEVYFALLGGIVGGFSVGGGFISAISLLITLFVRVIIGTADKESRLFSEPLLLRMSAALLGGFVFAVYEWLISGVSVATVLYGASMLLIPPLSVFLFSGMSDFLCIELLLGASPLPRIRGKDFQGAVSAVFFYVSAVIFLHIICRSLVDFSIFGIDPAFVFAAAVTLLVGARHGIVPAGILGFAVTLGIAGVQTVSFALLGLLVGLLFPFGAVLSVASGGLAFCLWAGYSGGLSGVLSTLPELIIAIAIVTPLLKGGAAQKAVASKENCGADTLSRVGTMALSYRSKYAENTERLIASVEAIAELTGIVRDERARPRRDEYRATVIMAIEDFCRECEHYEECARRCVCPAMTRCKELADILYEGKRISSGDINTEYEFCERRAELAKRINERASALEYDGARLNRLARLCEELSLLSKMMNDARVKDGDDVRLNAEKSELCERALGELGIENFSVRVFGEGRMRIFLAVEDPGGKIISSAQIREALGSALSAELDGVEYYRDGAVSMLECGIREKYSVSFSYKIKAGSGTVAGDSAAGIRTSDGAFYGVIADGMGRGAGAHEASEYLLSITKNLLSFGIAEGTLVKLLSCLMSRRGEAHSTLDLFRFDLYTGEGYFIKCGAAPSYVRRSGTIYRIGSEGTPIGVGAEALGERVGVDVRCGDIVIMTSDGVGETQGGQLKFIEKISGEVGPSLSSLAEEIVSLKGEGADDRTALVIRIEEGNKKFADA